MTLWRKVIWINNILVCVYSYLLQSRKGRTSDTWCGLSYDTLYTPLQDELGLQATQQSITDQTHTHFIEQQATKLCTCMLKRDYITFKVTYTEWFHCSNGTALAVSWCSQPSHALSLALDTLKYGEEHLVVWPTTVPLCLHHSHHLWQAHSCQDLLTLVLRTHWSEERRGSWTMW